MGRGRGGGGDCHHIGETLSVCFLSHLRGSYILPSGMEHISVAGIHLSGT